MNGYMNGGNWFWMAFMMVWLVVALGALIYLAVRLVGRGTQDRNVP